VRSAGAREVLSCRHVPGSVSSAPSRPVPARFSELAHRSAHQCALKILLAGDAPWTALTPSCFIRHPNETSMFYLEPRGWDGAPGRCAPLRSSRGSTCGSASRATFSAARLEPTMRFSSKIAWVRTCRYFYRSWSTETDLMLQAEGVGFEPTSPFGRRFSRPVH
jgi:hypothetical protein